MKKYLAILILTHFSFFPVHSQEKDNRSSKLGLKAGYFGEFVMHPGFYAGIDYSLTSKPRFNLHWDSEIGTYFHKWNNNALFVQSSIGTRFITNFSAFVDVNIGAGYMLSTPNGEVYSSTETGEISSEGKPYYSHFKPSISLLFGWDGMQKKNIPLLINVGLEGYWQSNFNHSMLPHAALRAGVVYKLKKS